MRENYHITEFEIKKDYDLSLKFEDGKSGIVNLKYLVGNGVFKKWENYSEFSKVRIDPISKTLSWDDEIDLDPVALRRRIEES